MNAFVRFRQPTDHRQQVIEEVFLSLINPEKFKAVGAVIDWYGPYSSHEKAIEGTQRHKIKGGFISVLTWQNSRPISIGRSGRSYTHEFIASSYENLKRRLSDLDVRSKISDAENELGINGGEEGDGGLDIWLGEFKQPRLKKRRKKDQRADDQKWAEWLLIHALQPQNNFEMKQSPPGFRVTIRNIWNDTAGQIRNSTDACFGDRDCFPDIIDHPALGEPARCYWIGEDGTLDRSERIQPQTPVEVVETPSHDGSLLARHGRKIIAGASLIALAAGFILGQVEIDEDNGPKTSEASDSLIQLSQNLGTAARSVDSSYFDDTSFSLSEDLETNLNYALKTFEKFNDEPTISVLDGETLPEFLENVSDLESRLALQITRADSLAAEKAAIEEQLLLRDSTIQKLEETLASSTPVSVFQSCIDPRKFDSQYICVRTEGTFP